MIISFIVENKLKTMAGPYRQDLHARHGDVGIWRTLRCGKLQRMCEQYAALPIWKKTL
jgi:hypothetical protein